ncbi:hypothetical protein M1403_03715 [Patescibacteria group bacterium]|nr:hypothetical protein [Patescibacteria group bacterium]
MVLAFNEKLKGNWYVEKRVKEALRRHESDGQYQTADLTYLGVTESPDEIAAIFSCLAQNSSGEKRIYARPSCTSDELRKYRVTEVYLTAREADKVKAFQATLIDEIRRRRAEILNELGLSMLSLLFRPDFPIKKIIPRDGMDR